jgi:hypothetical protein
MKIIGTLDTKDDGDILPEVLDQAKGMFDAVYAYDDGSIDNTHEVLKNHPVVSKLWRRDDFSEKERSRYLQHRRGWPLEQIKKDYPYETEETWVVRLEGDRFFMNQDPKEIVERAIHAEMDGRCGVMLDFRRHRLEGWDETSDTWPNWNGSIRNIQRWFSVDDVHNAIAFKVNDTIDYCRLNRPRPWPHGIKSTDCDRKNLTKDMAFFEHHGRRSPKYYHWTIESGSRPLSLKQQRQSPGFDYSTPETIYQTMESRFRPYKLFPYVDFDQSIDNILWLLENTDFRDNKQYKRYYFWGIEHAYSLANAKLPPRTDI